MHINGRTLFLLSLGLLLLIGGIGRYTAADTLARTPAFVNVRWETDVDDASRQALERRFLLEQPRHIGESSWSYLLTDTSKANVERLVRHESVADTHQIDRSRYETLATAERRGEIQRIALAVAPCGLILLLLAGMRELTLPARLQPIANTVLPRFERSADALARFPPALRHVVERAIPSASPEAAGAFRIVFVLAVLVHVLTHPVAAVHLTNEASLAEAGGLYGSAVRWLAGHPQFAGSIYAWLLVTGVLALTGTATTASYAGFAVGVVVWSAMWTLTTSMHAVGALVLATVGLVPSRWGDGWSIDSLLRKRRQRDAAPFPRGKQYGFTLWLPRLVFGVTFAAAAVAKLRNGERWITNGTVKYTFLADSSSAVVDWGTTLFDYPSVAVLLSLIAVAVEASLIFSLFVRATVLRSLLALAAAMLLLGFWLFQGIFWQAWWILIGSFLPFEKLRGRATSVSGFDGALLPAQIAAVIFVIGQQIAVSALSIEARPIFSKYDMYSTTYASLDDYYLKRNLGGVPSARVIALTASGRTHLTGCGINEGFVSMLKTAATGSDEDEQRLSNLLSQCAPDVGGIQAVQIEADQYAYDSVRRRYVNEENVVVVGPVRLR